jgi:integrase
MRTTLTKRIVATAEPRDRPYEIRDLAMKGLILRVQPSGYRAFIVEWGRGKRKTLGYAAHLTLEDARAQTLTAMAEALHQKLPSIAAKSADGPSLAAFLDEHYELWAGNELRGGKGYVDRIRKTFPDLLGASLGSIDVPTIEAWWRTRVHVTTDGRRPVSKVTASRDLACLRSALSKAVEWRLIATNPLAGLKNKTVASRKVVRYLTDDEERRLRQTLAHRDAFMVAARESANLWRRERNQATYPALPRGSYGDHLTPLVLLAMNTGLRRKELLTLQWSDIDLDGKMLTVRESVAKSGKQRFVPLNIEALAALTQWGIQRGRTGAVFAIRDAKTAWGRVLDEAGIRNFRFHDLRHHFASKLVRAHVDLNTVRELLGHSDLTMTLRYSHLSPSGLAAAVEKLA